MRTSEGQPLLCVDLFFLFSSFILFFFFLSVGSYNHKLCFRRTRQSRLLCTVRSHEEEVRGEGAWKKSKSQRRRWGRRRREVVEEEEKEVEEDEEGEWKEERTAVDSVTRWPSGISPAKSVPRSGDSGSIHRQCSNVIEREKKRV